MSWYWSKLATASPKFVASTQYLFLFFPPFILKVPFNSNCIAKPFKMCWFCWLVFFLFFLFPAVSTEWFVLDWSFLVKLCAKQAVGVTRWGYAAQEAVAPWRNGANGNTAVGTSDVKLLLFELYGARDCQLSHLQHINYVNCLCTFFNPDFSWIMDDRQGQNLLLVFPCDCVCAECTEQS